MNKVIAGALISSAFILGGCEPKEVHNGVSINEMSCEEFRRYTIQVAMMRSQEEIARAAIQRTCKGGE